MKSWRRETPRQAGRFTLAAATVVLAGAGCGADELGQIEVRQGALVGDINNWQDLMAMGSTGTYNLKVNLNASGQSWTPKSFSGTFDGHGHTISNLTINTTNPSSVGFFSGLDHATVRDVRFVNLNVTGNYIVGGLAGFSTDSLISLVAVNGTMSAPGGVATGGIVGIMYGGTIDRSYMKGAVNSSQVYAGGIAAYMAPGETVPEIRESYAWATVSTDTSDPNRTVWAGGIAGSTYGSSLVMTYAAGNVTGRGYVGGLVGQLDCGPYQSFVISQGIYRGDVVDKNKPAPAGWSGTYGSFTPGCIGRFDKLYWDRSLDGSTNTGASPGWTAQLSGTTTQLMSPTTPDGGIYSTADNKFDISNWEPGSSSQHHALKNTPGGVTIQPRCMNGSTPFAC